MVTEETTGKLESLIRSVNNAFHGIGTKISEHPVGFSIAAIDALTAVLVVVRHYYGFAIEPENHVAKFFLANYIPHILTGLAPVLTAAYLAARVNIKRIYGLVAGSLLTVPIFYREAVQNAYDSVPDSLETAAGIMTGILLSGMISNYVRNKYHST